MRRYGIGSNLVVHDMPGLDVNFREQQVTPQRIDDILCGRVGNNYEVCIHPKQGNSLEGILVYTDGNSLGVKVHHYRKCIISICVHLVIIYCAHYVGPDADAVTLCLLPVFASHFSEPRTFCYSVD